MSESIQKLVKERISDSVNLKKSVLENEELTGNIEDIALAIVKALKNGGKIVLCGNGGSASDALHFAGEIVGRFQKERAAWPAVVLNADVATMTAIANDYSYDDMFARQAEAHVTSKDVFIGLSTRGNSKNVLKAVNLSKDKGAVTVGFLGKDGGEISKAADYSLVVPSNVTARIQEVHILAIHIICEIVETYMVK